MANVGGTLPSNWKLAAGQILPIAGNDTLFMVIGNTYGGDGHTDFALPDLQAADPKGAGPAAPEYAICVAGVFP
jgi:microcystin-dependent protein